MAPGVTQGKIADVHMWKGLCISSLPGLRLAGDVPRRRLGDRPHHQLVDVDVRWSGNRPDDAIGDVGAGQRLHPLVDRGRPLPVPLEADQADFRPALPRGDLGPRNRPPHEFEPQRLTDGAHGVLARRVADTARINLEPRYRAEVHDMGAGCAPKQREEGFRDPQEADDVRLHHLNPVVIAALGQRLQAGGQSGVVDQHLDLTVFRLDGTRKALNAGEIPDVEGEPPSTQFACDRHQPILAAGAQHQPISRARQASRPRLTPAQNPLPPPPPNPPPPPTPRPTPPPTPAPSPEPTPNPTPPPTSTPPPTVPGGAATRAPVAQAAGASDIGTLPFAGEALPDGSAQAIAIDPTPQQATAADPGTASDTQNFFLLLVLAAMALPLLLVMTLLATVLTRR